ncbi:VanW family protein [Actinomycetaceae bacterium TAE3-ERU4]|nr:VanW family protein [Actinomycetaceae bacterium TAE3-ERU4]
MSDKEVTNPRNFSKTKVYGILGALAILLGGYFLLAWSASTHVPTRVKALGVNIGGLSSAEAKAALERAVKDRSDKPVEVVAGDKSLKIAPKDLGIKINIDQTLENLTAFSLSPKTIWEHFVGTNNADVKYSTDAKKLQEIAKKIENALNLDPQDAGIKWEGTHPVVLPAHAGIKVDGNALAQQSALAWVRANSRLDAKYEQITPKVTTESAKSVAEGIAQNLVSTPLKFVVEKQSAILNPSDLVKISSFAVEDSQIKLQIDSAKAVSLLKAKNSDLLKESQNARFEFGETGVKIIPSVTGQKLDLPKLSEQILAAAQNKSAEIQLEPHPQEPELTTEAAQKLGIKEVVSEFSTPYPSSPARNQNLRRGMEQITGKLVKPGESFSLEKALGDITEANGYAAAGVISDGMHVDALGGGLSQVCVTTLNTVFFAGLDITQHKPHSQYLRRYPMGRECTLWTGVHDLKFTNNTPYGVLLQGWIRHGKMTVRAWSTKYWEVKTTTSPKTKIVEPITETRRSRNCEPSSAGNAGFDVTVTRSIFHDGKAGKPLNWFWRYKPANAIKCEKP